MGSTARVVAAAACGDERIDVAIASVEPASTDLREIIVPPLMVIIEDCDENVYRLESPKRRDPAVSIGCPGHATRETCPYGWRRSYEPFDNRLSRHHAA